MATGTDFLLDALLKMAGVDVEQAKAQMKGFAEKFVEQDQRLKDIQQVQLKIQEGQAQILSILQSAQVSTDDGTDSRPNGSATN